MITTVDTPNVTRSPPEKRPRAIRRSMGAQRLSTALDESSEIPALADARDHLVRLLDSPCPNEAAIADVVESDLALTASVMRAANKGAGRRSVSGVPQAVDELGVIGIGRATVELATYGLFEEPHGHRSMADRLSTHAAVTREAAGRIAALANLPGRAELAVAALLHDIGKFPLARLNPTHPLAEDPELTHEEVVRRERLEFGLDHAVLGGVLARRWGLPDPIARGIERHHAEDATGIAAAVKLADMVVHHGHGETCDPEAILRAANNLGLGATKLRRLFYSDATSASTARRPTQPNPLSPREMDVLCGLAEGKRSKQIAAQLALSASTVRTHLSNVYHKFGVADRAQAVLTARDRGWI